MLGGLRGGRVGRVFWGRITGQLLQMINDELNDHRRRDGRDDRFPIAQRMPGAPVLQGSFISARGVARGAFMKEGRDRFLGLIGQALRVLQRRQRLGEQRRESEKVRLRFHLG